jgi:hypothetical protein
MNAKHNNAKHSNAKRRNRKANGGNLQPGRNASA